MVKGEPVEIEKSVGVFYKENSNHYIVSRGNFFYLDGQDSPITAKEFMGLDISVDAIWDGVVIKGRYYLKADIWNENWTTPYKIAFPFLECATPLIEELF